MRCNTQTPQRVECLESMQRIEGPHSNPIRPSSSPSSHPSDNTPRPIQRAKRLPAGCARNMPTFSTTRAAAVYLIVTVALVALLGRVAYLQSFGREQNIGRAERQQHQVQTLYARRGSIFDRSGMLLAGTVQDQSLFIDPKFMQDSFQENGHSLVEMDQAVAKLAHLLEKDPYEISKLLGDRYESRFVRVADHVDEGACAAIEQLKLPGVGLMPQNERYYPMGSAAAHVLGGVGEDGTGLEGVELRFEKLLSGRDGYTRTVKDAKRRPVSVAAEDYDPPQNGRHLILTIDSNMQLMAEQELAAACKQFAAKRGEVILIDPQNGEVLALADWPAFNPQYLDDSQPEVRRDRCVTDPYEPGSTIKPFIAGPALQWKLTRPDEVFPVHGPNYVTPYGRHVTDVHAYDHLAFWDVLVKSSNIGMSMLGERIGNDRLHAALASFDFGKPTGIELPGEDPGLLNPLRKWTKYSTESVSQGYELMVTPVQLARAMCAYANGGRLVRPHIIRGILDDDGQITAAAGAPGPADALPQAIDPATALQVRRILCDVPLRGTALGALTDRTWNIFGKTGTAHVTKGSFYSSEAFTSSFIGGAPAEQPRLVIAMVIHEPDRRLGHYGGIVSAPAACRVLDRAMAYLQQPASPPLPPPPPHIAAVLYEYHPDGQPPAHESQAAVTQD
jgi:cell division protein FtsI/penicillin-binding protein 2